MFFFIVSKTTLSLQRDGLDTDPFPSCTYNDYHETLQIGQYTVDFLENGTQSCYRGSFLLGGNDYKVTGAYLSKDKVWNYTLPFPNAEAILMEESDKSSVFKIECISGVESCKYQIAKIMPSYKKGDVFYRTYISTVKNGQVNFEYSNKKIDGYYIQYQGIFLNLNKRNFIINASSSITFNQSGLTFNKEKSQYYGTFDTVHLKPEYHSNTQTTDNSKLSISYSQEYNKNKNIQSDIAWFFPELTSFLDEGTSIMPQRNSPSNQPFMISLYVILGILITLGTLIILLLTRIHKKESNINEIKEAHPDYEKTVEHLIPDA